MGWVGRWVGGQFDLIDGWSFFPLKGFVGWPLLLVGA